MIRLLCVEDDPLMRAYLTARLAEEADIQVVNAVADVQRAMICLGRDDIDVVLLDCQLPGRDGCELIQRMCPWATGDAPDSGHPAILFCTGFADEAFQSRARLLGARGVVAKERLASDLVPAIRAVCSGELWFKHPAGTRD
jgi:DNA-binding NarL/FixJ family response regulator